MYVMKKKHNRAAALLVAFVLVFLAVGRLQSPVYASVLLDFLQRGTLHVEGFVGHEIEGESLLNINLAEEEFRFLSEILDEQGNLSSWFERMPHGLTAAVAGGSQSVIKISISGTPTETFAGTVSLTIPAEFMTNEGELIIRNAVRFNITDPPPARSDEGTDTTDSATRAGPGFGPLINGQSTTLYENIPYKITLETVDPSNPGLTFDISPALPLGLTFIRVATAEHPAGTIYGSPIDYNRNTITYTVNVQGANTLSSSARFSLTIADTPTQAQLERLNAYPIIVNPRTGRDGHIGTLDPATGFYEITGPRNSIGNQYMYIGDRFEYTNDRSNSELFDSFWLDGKKMTRGVDYTVEKGNILLTLYEQTVRNLSNGQHTAAVALKKPRNPADNGLENDLDYVAQNFVVRLSDSGGAVRYGDLDGDGKVGQYDLLLMLRFFARPGTTIDQTAADVNSDGKVNSADLIEMMKHFSIPGHKFGPK